MAHLSKLYISLKSFFFVRDWVGTPLSSSLLKRRYISLQSEWINYHLVEDVLTRYENLQKVILAKKRSQGMKPRMEGQFQGSFELCEAYNFYQKEGKWPQLHWHKLPFLYSARLNSRGSFALIAFFLIPNWRDHLKATCDFIATTWWKAWFSNQHSTGDSYNQLHTAVSKLNCPKALRCFSTHWIQERSVLDVPHSNMVVELMEELHSTCKTDKYLNSKFINSNSEI